MPYFKAKKFKKVLINVGIYGTCTQVMCNDNHKNYYLIPAVPIHRCGLNEKNIATHELIHATRKTFHGLVEEPGIIGELFAESYKIIQIHDLFILHPIETIKARSKISTTRRKLHNCFEDKADYCFIRLKMEEVEHLADSVVDENKVVEYFKDRASNETSSHMIGELRFKIICEKLGI